MQTNSQHLGHLRNFNGKEITPGDGASNALGQKKIQLRLPAHSASSSYPGQSATGSCVTQFTCTIPQANSDKILTSSAQATKDGKLAQDNQFNLIRTLPAGQQDTKIILWNMPSSCQIFIPVTNIKLQGAPINNGPNMSNCAYNSMNSLLLQQPPTSLAATNNSQQGKAKKMGTKSPTEARRTVNTSSLSRQHRPNTPIILQKDSLKTRSSLSSNLQCCSPAENASQSSLLGGLNHSVIIPEKSTHVNSHPFSTFLQNIAAQRAVAVVTPLSPIGTTPVNIPDNSVNMKINVRPVQEIVYHQTNVSHSLATNANLMNQTEETNAPPSRHQQPKSTEPKLNDGLCNAIRTTVQEDSSSQCHIASSPIVNSVVVEPETSIQLQNESSDRVKNSCPITENKTSETNTIPVIEWPLDRLQTLIQQMEDAAQNNLHKSDAGRDILKHYWNGDCRTFSNAAETGMYQNIMEEVYFYSPMKEPVILRQMLNDARNKAVNNFLILKHNEEPPKMTYNSSWLNLNANVDDIDKECGYPLFYNDFASEHGEQDIAPKTPKKLQVALETTITVAKDQDVLTNTSGLDDNCSIDVGAKGVIPKTTNPRCYPRCENLAQPSQEPAVNAEEETDKGKGKVIAALLDEHKTSLLNAPRDLGTTSSEEEICKKISPRINVEEQTSCRPNTVNPLKAITHLVRILKNRDVSLKYNNLFRESSGLKNQKCLSAKSKPNKILCNRVLAESSVLTDMSSHSDCTSPPVLDPEVEVQQEDTPVENESTEKMHHSDSDILTIRCEADSNPGKELGEKGVMDSSASIKVHSLLHDMVKQCNAGQSIDDKDIAESQELMHKASLLHSSQVLDMTTNEQESLEKTSGNCSSKENVVEDPLKTVTNLVSAVRKNQQKTGTCSVSQFPTVKSRLDFPFCIGATSPDVDMDVSASFRICVLPHEVAKQCFAGQFTEDVSLPPEMMQKPSFCNFPQETSSLSMGRLEEADGNCSPKSNVVAEQTNCQSNTLYPLNAIKIPVTAVGKNESSEEMFDPDCIIIDERVSGGIVQKPGEERPVNTNKVETEQFDALDLIKIDVLPHELAELWFSGEVENKDLKKETAVDCSTEEKIQNMVKFEKELPLEDIKTEESKYQIYPNKKLETFCCLGKWFQTLEYGSDLLCTCLKNVELSEDIKTEDHNTRLKIPTENENPKECEMEELENTDSEVTDDSENENPEDENPLPSDTALGISSAKTLETELSEQARNESPSNCAANKTLMHNEIEQDTSNPHPERPSDKICLTLYGKSSDRRKEAMSTKRYKKAKSCEEPPETLQVIVSSQQIIKRKRKSNKSKGVESKNDDFVGSREKIKTASRRSLPSHPFTELGKNALSSTSVRTELSPIVDSHLRNGNKRKRQYKGSTQQMSMNKYIIRGKTIQSKLLHSAENILKSKYELGNPALMPLQEGLSLEFKVLPESFNFEEVAEPDCTDEDASSRTQNGMSGPEDKSKRMKTGCSTIQGAWSFSPLKKKHTQSTEATNISGPCSLFQEFKKRYHEKKEIASKTKMNSSETP